MKLTEEQRRNLAKELEHLYAVDKTEFQALIASLPIELLLAIKKIYLEMSVSIDLQEEIKRLGITEKEIEEANNAFG